MKILFCFVFVWVFSFKANSQTINIDNGIGTSALVFAYPFYFEKANCRFQALGGASTANEFQNFFHEGCSNKNYKLIIDNYSYDLVGDFTVFYFDTSYQIFEFIPLGSCASISGGTLFTGASFTGSFSAVLFDIESTTDFQYYANDINPTFKIISRVGDIFCANGILVVDDDMFLDGFE